MTNTSPEGLGTRLSVSSLTVGSGHARLYPCELHFTSDCGSRCCCQVHTCFWLPVVLNALNLANTNARPPCIQTTLEVNARGGTLFTRGDIIHGGTLFTGTIFTPTPVSWENGDPQCGRPFSGNPTQLSSSNHRLDDKKFSK